MTIDGKPVPTWLPPEIFRDKAFAEKYLIEHELGVGGAGVVVGARHRELDERVAIKFLLPGQSSEAVSRFRREARAASRIKNQHVVRINDVSTTESGIPYIVMEYLDGMDLERMLQQSRNRQLPTHDAIEFILQACEALAECHGLGIVHRDLKPSNLFCVHGADGLAMIKVLDFGISKLVATTSEGDTTDHSRILGSPRYMSPEQFDNSTSVDNRTDIWAIGVILYELLTGVVPFADTDMLKIWQKIRSQEPEPMAKLRPDLPAALPPVVAKCLEKDRGRRYANLAELAKALLPFAPERARASVARIVRTVEAPGTMTSALDLPMVHDVGTSHAPTFESIHPGQARRKGANFKIAVVILAAFLGATILFAYKPRTAPAPVSVTSDDRRSAGEQVTKAEPASAQVPPASVPMVASAIAADSASAPPSDLRATPNPAKARPKAKPLGNPSPSLEPADLAIPPGSSATSRTAMAEAIKPLPSASATAATSSPTSRPEPSSPWIVDIVEQRRGGAP